MEENDGAQRLMDDIFNKDTRKAIQEREPEEDRMLEWGCRFNATTSAFAYKSVQLVSCCRCCRFCQKTGFNKFL